MQRLGFWSKSYTTYEHTEPKLTGFIKVLANKSIPPFLNVVKTLMFVPKENADLTKDPHLVISIDHDNTPDTKLAPGHFILLYVNPDDLYLHRNDQSNKIIDVTDKVDQMELIVSFLIRHKDYIMTSRAMVPFDLILVNKIGGEINVGPTSIQLIWDSLGVGFQSFKFAVKSNFLGVPSGP